MKSGHWKKARAARLLSLCLFLAGAILLQACTDSTEPVVVLEGETMGTYYQIKLVGENLPGEDLLKEVTEEALEEVNQMMSTYIADSELMRLNDTALNTWIPVSEPLYSVLETSEAVSRMSDGAFDITVGPLVNLWGFGPAGMGEPPTAESLERALQTIGYQNVELNPETRQVRRLLDVHLDLSAVAKGYGADYVAAAYRRLNLQNFMVEIGGELHLAGHNAQGEPWRIGVETPSFTRTGVVQPVAVTEVGMATSGDYRNYYEVEGERVSHTIDPVTGRPISHRLASVTVIAETAAKADALATALNVMGVERARRMAQAEGVAAFFIERSSETEQGGGEFVTSYTEAFERYLP